MENNAIATVNNPFGIERGGMYCSLAAETQDERLAVYSAVSNAESLDDYIGTPINVANVVIQSVDVEDARWNSVPMPPHSTPVHTARSVQRNSARSETRIASL